MKDWVACQNYGAGVVVPVLSVGLFSNIANLVDAGHGFEAFGNADNDVHEFQANESLTVLRIVGTVAVRTDYAGTGGGGPVTFALHERISLGIQDLTTGGVAMANDFGFGSSPGDVGVGAEDHFLWERVIMLEAFDGEFVFYPLPNSHPWSRTIDLRRKLRVRRGEALVYRAACIPIDSNATGENRCLVFPLLRTLLAK